MAFTVEGIYEQATNNDVVDKIEIQQNGGAGRNLQLEADAGRNGFKWKLSEITSDSDGGLINPLSNKIQTGKLTFYPRIETSAEETLLDDIVNSPDTDFRIVWKQKPTGGSYSVKWTGNIENKMRTYPEKAGAYYATIRAKDFDLLKTIDYTLDDTRQTLITTIADLLGELNFNLNIRTATSWITEDTTDSTDFLSQIYHETKGLREFARTQQESDQPINVWDALTHLGDPALLFRQVNGEFTVEQLSEFDNPANVHETLYNSDGTVNTATTTVDRTLDADKSIDVGDLVVKNDSQNDRYPAIRRAEVRWNHRTKVSRVDQATFELDDSTNTSESVSDVIISDGDQTLDFGIVAGGSRSGSLTESVLRYSIFMAGYWWDQSEYEWVPDTGTEIENEVDLTNTTNKPTLTLWIGGEAYETDNIPADADGIMTVKAYIPSGLEEANVTVFLDILNPQAYESSKFVDFKITQEDGYSTDFELNDTWFGDGPLAYSVSALRYGTGDGDITQDSWQRRGTTTGYRNFHENLLKEILDLQRSNVRKLNANFWGSYDPSKILVYDSENFYCAGVSYTGHLGRWSANLFRINLQTATTDDYDDIPRFREDNETGTSSTEETTTTGGISQNEGDARYFRQSQAFDELATADIDTALTNLGLKGGSRDLDLQSLDINGSAFVDGSRNVTGGTADFSGSLDASTLRTDTGKFLSPTSYQFRNAGDTGFRDAEMAGLTTNTDSLNQYSIDVTRYNSNTTLFGVSEHDIIGSAGSFGGALVHSRARSFGFTTENESIGNLSADNVQLFIGGGGATNVGFYTTDPKYTVHNEGAFLVTGDVDHYTNEQVGITLGRFGRTDASADRRHEISWRFENVDAGNYINFLVDDGSSSSGNPTSSFKIYGNGNLDTVGDVSEVNFSTGWIAEGGQGYSIYEGASNQWNAEFNNLLIRGRLKVFELIVKQIATLGGTEILSVAVAEADSVSGSAGSEVITVTDPRNFGGSSLQAGDLIIIQQVDLNDTTVVKQEFRVVESVSGTDVTLVNDSNAGTATDVIEEGDIIVAYGNIGSGVEVGNYTTDSSSTNTGDDARQNMMYRSVEGELVSRFQTGVSSYADFNSPGSTSNLIMGDLDDAQTLSNGTTPSGFGFYAKGSAYLEGEIVAISGDIGGWAIQSDRIYKSLSGATVEVGQTNEVPDFEGFNAIKNTGDNEFIAMGYRPSRDIIQMQIRQSGLNEISLGEDDSGKVDFGMRVTSDGNDVVLVGSDSAQFFGAFVDDTGLWAGGGATSNPATKSDSNFWAKFDTGEFFYDALVITVWARDTIAGFGAGSTADSLQDDEWTAQRASSTAGDNVIENKIKARYRHRFGINNMLLNYLIRVESSGDGTGTGAVYLRVRNQSGTSVASGNIDVGPTGTTEDTLEVDVSSLNVGQYYTVEVDLEAQVGNVNSGTVTITSHLREDAIIYATT